VDSEGGHDGTWTNGPTPAPGVLYGGLDFDGSNDYVDVPHDDNLSLTTFSISSWIRPTALNGWRSILYKGTQNTHVNYYLGTDDDEISFGFYNSSWEIMTTSSANLSTDQWSHVAVTFDSSSGEGKAYLNGVLIHTETTGNSPIANTDALTIGRDQWGEYWSGLLDDIRLYDRVLGDSEISDLYSEGAPPAATGYVEAYQSWNAGSAGVWETVDLGSLGVPPDAVLEIAIENTNASREREAGVRAVGTAFSRNFDLHEAEAGGVAAVVVHVQANGSRQI
ncbi:MAG: LamG domain-containing protein, partial [bacterium]|nr:LamG domain-containing protein [bacterium]